MIDKLALLKEAHALQAKSTELSRAREIAARKWQLEETQFENTLQNDKATEQEIEAARLQVVTFYEQFIDSCLLFRAQSNAAIARLDQIHQEILRS